MTIEKRKTDTEAESELCRGVNGTGTQMSYKQTKVDECVNITLTG